MIKSEAYGKYKGYIILKTIGLKPPIYSIEDLEVAFKSPDEALRYVNSLSSRKNTGEMSKSDLEKGGEWYEARLELESLCKKAGYKCEVYPFDVYQGPYAFISGVGSVWFSSENDPYNYFLKISGKKIKFYGFNTSKELKELIESKKSRKNTEKLWGIYDWAMNRIHPELDFTDFEDAWGYIRENYPEEDYEELAVYEIKEIEKKNPKKPPKYWWDYMVKKIKKENPTYNKEQIAGTVGKIWWHNLTQKKRNEIIKKEWKNPYILSDIHETIFIDSSSLNYDIKTTMDKSKAKIFDTERAALQFLKTNFYGKPTAWVSTEIEEKEMESIKTIIPRVIKKIKKKSKKNIKEQWFTGEIKKVYDSPQWRKGAKTFFIKINDLEEVESILFPERFDKGLKDGMKIKYTKYLKPDGSFLINEIRKIKE